MDSKFAFNKLLFLEMDRKNILLNRRTTFTSSSSDVHQNQVNSSFLHHFLGKATNPQKTKGSVSKCLFGRPEAGETQRMEEQMFHQQRMRALNLYQFDLATQQPMNLTPPASPYIGHTPSSASDRVQFPSDRQGQRRHGQEEKRSLGVGVEDVARGALERVAVDDTVIVRDTCEGGSSEAKETNRINRTSLKRRSSDLNEDDEEEQQSSCPVDETSNGKDH